MGRPYIPHTETDEREMLATIGSPSIDDLFREIPTDLHIEPGSLNLPPALDEARLMTHLGEIAAKNVDLTKTVCFLGAGIYDRFIPQTVNTVISRGEFLTAYTPYQPEASQGYLQTIYEFQSMVAELYGMDLANASMYDGATAMAEAAIMAVGLKGGDRVAVSGAMHPHYKAVLRTYCWAVGVEVVELPCEDGATLDYANAEGTACVIVGYPNFYGSIVDLAEARRAADASGGLLVVVADPVACALLKTPGSYGADIVVGEGQAMGVPMGLGGPLVGLFACKKEYVRAIPGRIVGRTTELHGDRQGYVMTLRTREQDIRREKATSNICTNEALMALACTVYMATLGKNGMRQIAESSVRNAEYAKAKLVAAGAKLAYPNAKTFDEFVLDLGRDATWVRDALLEEGLLAGLPLGPYDPTMQDHLLVAVTELRTRAQIDAFAEALKSALA